MNDYQKLDSNGICRGFVRSLHKAFTVLGIAGTTRGSAIKNTTDAAERALRDGSGSVEEHHGGKRVLSEHKSRSDQPWVTWARPGCLMLEDPKHPRTPGYITDDVFRCI